MTNPQQIPSAAENFAVRRGVFFVVLLLSGCADDDAPGGELGSGFDSGARDARATPEAGPVGDTGSDAGRDLDAELFDHETSSDLGSFSDAGSDDVMPADLGPSVDAGEIHDLGADASSDAGCDYLDLDLIIVKCASAYAYARRWVDLNSQCADYYELTGHSGPSLSGVIEDAMCDPSCEYRARMSVSFIDPCGRRNGYIVYGTADDELCPPLYEFAEGLFPSREAWEKVINCGG